MRDSPYKVYCVYKKVQHVCEKKNWFRSGSFYESIGMHYFKRNPSVIINKAKSIYSDIASNQYTYDEYLLTMIHNVMMTGKTKFRDINHRMVDGVSNIYNDKQLKLDKKKLKVIDDSIGLGEAYEYFIIQQTGESIIYKLIIEGSISPMIFVTYIDSILTGKYEKCYFLKSDNYETFEQIALIIADLINSNQTEGEVSHA